MSSLCEVYEQVIPKLKKCIDDVKSYAGEEEYRERLWDWRLMGRVVLVVCQGTDI